MSDRTEELAEIIFREAGPFASPNSAARAIVAAGWVSREEYAEIVRVFKEQHEFDVKRADKAEAKIARVEALAEEWRTTIFKIPAGHPMTVDEFCRTWFKEPLDAALADPEHDEEPHAEPTGICAESHEAVTR